MVFLWDNPADISLHIRAGETIESGSHRELLAHGRLYAKLYRLHRHPLRSMRSDRNIGQIVP
jgi:hypothetical protein